MPDTGSPRQALARLIGLYLSFSYVVLPVASLLCWRRGQHRLAAILLMVPLAAWALWELSGALLTPFARLHVGVGLLPVLLYAPLAALAWLASLSAPDGATVMRRTPSLPAWARTGLRFVGVAGVGWFLYGLFRLEHVCSMDAASLRSHLPQVALCASSAAGTWPLLLPMAMDGVNRFVRSQAAGTPGLR